MSNSTSALFLKRHFTFSGSSKRSSSLACTSANSLTDLVSLGCVSRLGSDFNDADERNVSTTENSFGIWPTEPTDLSVGSDSEDAK